MAQYTVRTDLYDQEVAQIVNAQNATIKQKIDDFNSQLNVLANGETWMGGSAVTNVNDLVIVYNTYKDNYSEFIRCLGQDLSSAFSELNGIISTNRGTQLSFGDIQSLSFDTPKINDLSLSGGESGDPDTIINCADAFVSYSDEIKSAYMKIQSAFEKIGAGSQILDTSAMASDPATKIKNGVIEIIGGFKQVDENAFKTTIENLRTAANNIKNG